MFARVHPSPFVVRRATLAVVCVATAILMLDIAVVNTALPAIGADLDTDITGLKWIVDAYTLTLAASVLAAGTWADRRGRRRAFAIGLGVFTASSAACAAAPNLMLLAVARGVQGVGAAVLFACSLALLAHAFPAGKERMGALAVYGATIGASFTVGPLVGGAITQGLDWRWIFLVNVPIGVGALCATILWVRESRSTRPRRPDHAGQVLAAASLALLVLALLRTSDQGWTATEVLVEFAAAGAAALAFAVVELRSDEPMLPTAMFRDRHFTGAQVTAFSISCSLFAVFLFATLYVQAVLGMTPIQAGLVYLPGTVVMFLVAGATAAMTERYPAGRLIAFSLVLVAAGLLLMLLAGTTSSWVMVLPGSIVAFIGSGIFNPVMSSLVLSAGTDEQSALAAGVNDAFRQTGIAVGVAALGTLVPTKSIGAAFSPAAFTSGLHHALILAAGLALAGAVAAVLLIRARTDGPVLEQKRFEDEPAAGAALVAV
jgi:EmrB/QacA subfamily drug resistance transporter